MIQNSLRHSQWCGCVHVCVWCTRGMYVCKGNASFPVSCLYASFKPPAHSGGQGGFFQGYYGGSGPAGPYAFTGYHPTQNPMDYQRQFNQGGGHMHGQPVSGDFPQGFDQAFSHQPGYDGGWGGGDLWGDPMGQPPSYDTHVGGYGYGANG